MQVFEPSWDDREKSSQESSFFATDHPQGWYPAIPPFRRPLPRCGKERLRMTQKQIAYFEKAYHTGNIALAAEQMYVSRSVISRSIQEL